MREYTVNDEIHHIFTPEAAPKGLNWKENWQKSKKGDWVMADDGYIIQVLDINDTKMGKMYKTCIGTYTATTGMDTKDRKDRHSISGKSSYEKLIDRKVPTNKEILFAARLAGGQGPTEAYLAIYDTKNENTAKKKAAILIKTERIKKILKKDLEDVFEDLGADTRSMVEVVWNVAQNGKNDSDRLKAASMMWEAADLVEKHKVTEVRGLFQGYDPTQIEDFKRPQEIASLQATTDEDGHKIIKKVKRSKKK
jgi:hypothetical protein